MKTLISFIALTALIVTSSFTIETQQKLNEQSQTGCFNNVRAHRQGKGGVTTTWAVSATNIVSFVVERSYDDWFYENAGTVNFNGTSSYKFTDNSLFPGIIYYRITAIKSDGTTECSQVVSVRIVQRG